MKFLLSSWYKEIDCRRLFFLFVLMSTEGTVATKRLFVGNLPFRLDEDGLAQIFAEVGPVLGVIIPTDRETGRKKGFAFVDVAEADMQSFIDAMNGKEVMGRPIVVNEARPREERPARREWN